MDFREVDLAVALRAVSYHRMNRARKVRRRMKQLEKNGMAVLLEQSSLDSLLMIISHDVHQVREAFRRINKIEKRVEARQERRKHVVDQMAGRNQGNFRNR